VLAEPHNHGFGRANLLGAQAARGEYLALLNSDTEVAADWLLPLLRSLQNDSQIAAACSLLRLMDRPMLLNARGGGMSRLGYGYDIDFGLPYVERADAQDVTEVDVLFPSGAAMLMRRSEFLELGGFDPAYFMYHEDVDLGWRLWLLGRRVVLCPRSVVLHAFGGTTGAEMAAGWRDVMGNRHHLRTLWKHYEFRHAVGATLRLLRDWMRGGHFLFAARVLWWNLLQITDTWRQRRLIQNTRSLTDAELIARGLISLCVPAAPDLSVVDPLPPGVTLANNPWLWPGRSSAIGRLGPGWYLPEDVQGTLVRGAADGAIARLDVTPNSSGTLRIRLRRPNLACGGRLQVVCNEVLHDCLLLAGTDWQELCLQVTADQLGSLNITLLRAEPEVAAPRWDWDLRHVLCEVSEISFQSSDTPTYVAPRSVTVLITTFNRQDILGHTLDALSRQTCREFDVVVVNDGSTDDTWELLQSWKADRFASLRLTILTQPNTGQGLARNHGLAHAHGDLVLFIGDDTIPEPDFIEQHLRCHADAGMPCAVVGYTDWDRSAMHVTPFLAYVNEGGHQFGYRYMKDGSDVPYTCCYTSNLSVPRAVLGEEPFDPSFRTYGWEDIELGYRLSRRGLRLIYHRAARVHHRHPMSLRDFYARQIKVGAAIGSIYALHPQLEHDPLMPPQHRPRWWRGFLALCIPPLLPFLDLLDRLSLPMPERVYRIVLSAGFWAGRDRATSAGSGA